MKILDRFRIPEVKVYTDGSCDSRCRACKGCGNAVLRPLSADGGYDERKEIHDLGAVA